MQVGTFQPFKVSAQLLATRKRAQEDKDRPGDDGRKVGSFFSFKGAANQADSRLFCHRGRG